MVELGSDTTTMNTVMTESTTSKPQHFRRREARKQSSRGAEGAAAVATMVGGGGGRQPTRRKHEIRRTTNGGSQAVYDGASGVRAGRNHGGATGAQRALTVGSPSPPSPRRHVSCRRTRLGAAAVGLVRLAQLRLAHVELLVAQCEAALAREAAVELHPHTENRITSRRRANMMHRLVTRGAQRMLALRGKKRLLVRDFGL